MNPLLNFASHAFSMNTSQIFSCNSHFNYLCGFGVKWKQNVYERFDSVLTNLLSTAFNQELEYVKAALT